MSGNTIARREGGDEETDNNTIKVSTAEIDHPLHRAEVEAFTEIEIVKGTGLQATRVEAEAGAHEKHDHDDSPHRQIRRS